MRASSTGSGLERFYSALSTQPSWNNGVAGAPGSGWSSPGGGAWASGPFSAPQLDLPLISLRQQQQEVCCVPSHGGRVPNELLCRL